jgi:EmrB/QacA subfamily drug resistance transporter
MPILNEQTRKWWVLAAMIAGSSLVFIDQTALPVALLKIQNQLNATQFALQWIINAYLLVLATLIIFGGKLGDLIGQRKTFLYGLLIFSIASCACALGNSSSWLIAWRAVQGVGGAMMIPASSALVITAFLPEERGKAFGILISISSVFLILGPIIGGLLTQYSSWRWVFWINLPVAIVGVGLTLFAVPKVTHLAPRGKLDYWGFIWLTIALFSLVFALMEGINLGWTSPTILVCFLIAVGTLGLFLIVEIKHHNPLIDLQLFTKNRYFAYSNLLLFVVQIVFMSAAVFWVLYFQYTLAVSASIAGLMLLPANICLTFMAPIAGRMIDRSGARFTSCLGAIIVSASCLWIAITAHQHHYFWLLPGLLGFGCSGPLLFASCMSTALSSVLPEKRGVGSGIINGIRQLGSVLGVAILGSIIISVNQRQLQAHATAVDAYTFAFSCAMLCTMLLALIGIAISQGMPRKLAKL